MISIKRIGSEDADLLSELSIRTFYESHGHSASEEDIINFVSEKYNAVALKKELEDANYIFHILYYNNKVAGFSKIILNIPYANSADSNVAKLERIYLLQEFYGLKLGQHLLTFNIDLVKENKQAGLWLFVWTKNQRAFNFYKKNGFIIIGNFQYEISPTHSNPNYQMLLSFS